MTTKTRLEIELIAKSTFERAIKNEFNLYKEYWEIEPAKDCIITAEFYSHFRFAEEMKKELKKIT